MKKTFFKISIFVFFLILQGCNDVPVSNKKALVSQNPGAWGYSNLVLNTTIGEKEKGFIEVDYESVASQQSSTVDFTLALTVRAPGPAQQAISCGIRRSYQNLVFLSKGNSGITSVEPAVPIPLVGVFGCSFENDLSGNLIVKVYLDRVLLQTFTYDATVNTIPATGKVGFGGQAGAGYTYAVVKEFRFSDELPE